MIEDTELLRRYVVEGREEAFTELVQRHVNLVYSAALRRVGHDRQLGEEITQTVFIHCARKAETLQHHPALSGWLHRSTRFAAVDALRAKRCREHAEEIVTMNPPASSSASSEPAWSEIRPVIDAFLDRLADRERDAVVWRFFEGLSFAQIGAKLRVSEDAARMRVERALEKLRAALARRGINSTAVALGLTLTQHATVAAPVGFATTVSAGALAVAAAGGSGGVLGAALLMINKTQIGILGALVAGGLATAIVEVKANRSLERETTASRASNREIAATVSAAPVVPADSTGLTADNPKVEDLARLRARIRELKARPDGVVDAEIKPKSAWRNAGYDTPEAAIETLMWAATNERLDALAQSYVFGEATKAEADAFFAKLSPEIQARYGTPERLFSPYVLDGGEKDKWNAMQVIEVLDGGWPDEALVRYWVGLSDGTGRVDELPFKRVEDKWRFGSRAMGISIPDAVEFLRRNVDPSIVAPASGNEP